MGNNINNYNTNMMTTNDLMTGFSRSTWSPNAITDDLQVYGGGVPNMALLKDELISIGGRVGKFSGSVKFDDDLVDDLKAGDRIKTAAKKVGGAIKSGAKKVGSGIKKVAGKVHSSAMKNGGYSGSVSAKGIKAGGSYKLDDDDDDDDDLVDDLALFTAIKEKRQAAKAKKAAKKAALTTELISSGALFIGGQLGLTALMVAEANREERKRAAAIAKRAAMDDDLVDELKSKFAKFSEPTAASPALLPCRRKQMHNCIGREKDLVDDLGSAKGKIGKFSGGIKWADNSLTCDSEGNCMLKDELKFEKVKAVAGKAAQRFPGAASKVANKVKSLRGRDDDDE